MNFKESENIERVILEILPCEPTEYYIYSIEDRFDPLKARETSFELIVDNLLLRFLAAPTYRKNFELQYTGDTKELSPPKLSVLEHLVQLQNRTAPLIRAAEEIKSGYESAMREYSKKDQS